MITSKLHKLVFSDKYPRRHATKTSGLIGDFYEDYALKFLEGKGLELITRNYRCRFGEIDLIMCDGEEVVFVEVRSRAPSMFGDAIDSLDYNKMQKLERAGNVYLKSQYSDKTIPSYRYDLVAINIKDQQKSIELLSSPRELPARSPGCDIHWLKYVNAF